jgi:KDO2-lipid IV(A) lauroyltransferase
VLEFGSEVALEIVLDDEDAEEIRIAPGAKDVPGKSGETEGRDGGGMKQAEGVTPALRKQRPEKDGASGENDGSRSFCEHSEAEKKTEEQQGEPRCSREDRRVFVACEAQDHRGADHRDREHSTEGHVSGGSVREADHADSRWKQKQQPASGFRTVQAQRQPGKRQRGEQCRDGAWQPRGGFAHTKEPEAQRSAPIEKRRLLKPGLSVKAGRDPIAGLGHVARDPRDAGFAGPHEADGAKMAEVTNKKRWKDEDDPANLGCGAEGRALGDGSDCFGHGKLSLTSNHYLPAMDLLHTVARQGNSRELGNAMKEWIEYAAAWIILKGLGALPRPLARTVATGVTRILYALLPGLRKTAEVNLSIAFPDWSGAQRNAVIRGMLRNLGWMAAEFARFPKYSEENIEQMVVLDGHENFLAGQRRGKGVLYLTGHIGAWELSSFAHALYGFPLHYMARRIDNRRIDRLINSYRCLPGNRPIFKNESARMMLKVLKEAGTVGILADQNTMPGEAVFVDFFGKKASTTTGIARVALHTDAAVVPVYAIWDETSRKYRLRFEPPVELIRTSDTERDVLENTQKFTKVIEEIIRKYPEQWVWVHGRWNTRPQGEPAIYDFS